jgi:hypothetical protein
MAAPKPDPKSPRAGVFDSKALPRCRSRILVQVHVAGRVESAAIVDLSPTGARIVGPALALEPGTPVEIHYPAVKGVSPMRLRGEFVRATADGFAIRIVRD